MSTKENNGSPTSKPSNRSSNNNNEPQRSEVGNSNTIDQIEKFLVRSHDFRHNVVTGQLEFKQKDESEYRPLLDRDENNFWRELHKDQELQSAKVYCSLTSLRAILQSDFSKEFDPLQDYITNLPKWDGTTDHIAELATTVKTDNDELFQRLLKTWLVAAVGSIMVPEVVNQTALIFSGGQGIGKTSWILKLVPEQLKTYVYTGTINLNNKDTYIYLSNCFLINMDELENMSGPDIGTLKEIITKPHIKVRRVYARNAEDLPRRASFAGSVNSNQFLNDSTGSRRFLCFEALEFNYQHKVDMDDVYAQAYSLFQQGYKHWLDMEEIAELEVNNSKFQKTTAEEDLMLEEFLPATEGDQGILYYTATQIAEHLAKKGTNLTVNTAITQRLGKAMRKHGFTRSKKDGVWKYAVVLKQPSRT